MLPHAPTPRIIGNRAKAVLPEPAEDMRQLLGVLADVAAHDVAGDARALEVVELGAVDGVEEAGVADLRPGGIVTSGNCRR